MSKLAALCLIKGILTKKIYAEKYDELECIMEGINASIFLNKRTMIKFPSENINVGQVADDLKTIFFEDEEKLSKSKKRKSSFFENSNQLDLFQ